MSFTISDDILRAARMSEAEMAAELAVIMYHRGKLSADRAAEFARMDVNRFKHLLASRNIPTRPEFPAAA